MDKSRSEMDDQVGDKEYVRHAEVSDTEEDGKREEETKHRRDDRADDPERLVLSTGACGLT